MTNHTWKLAGDKFVDGEQACAAKSRVLLCLLLYFGIVIALYIFLAKRFVAPYLLIGLDGEALSFGDSATPCWLGFSVAMAAGLRWPARGRIGPALAAAVLAPVCAGGFCVLGYSLLAAPGAGPVLCLLGLGTLAAARLALRSDAVTAAGLAISVPMLASLLVFNGMTAGTLSAKTLPEVEGAADWHQIQELALDEAEVLEIGDVKFRVAPLPKNETARYSHSKDSITVSASSIQGAETTEEVAEGVLHALAHCSQARLPEAWPDLEPSEVKAWLAKTDGACPPTPEGEAASNHGLEQIELQATDRAKDRSAQIANM